MLTANALVGRLVPRAERGTVYGITASAMFLGNSLGPLTGGAVAAAFGLRWALPLTAAVPLANLLWVDNRVPEYLVAAGSVELTGELRLHIPAQ